MLTDFLAILERCVAVSCGSSQCFVQFEKNMNDHYSYFNCYNNH